MVSRDVIEACRRGDPRAFEEVVRTTYRQVYTQALRLVGDRLEAEDVTQDAYLRVFRGLPGFRGDAHFETWLYRIVANSAMSHLRRRGRFGDLLAEPEDPKREVPAETHVAEEAVDRQELANALHGLPLSLRSVVVMKDVYGFSCLEIGEQIGISEGAVKVRLHRARKRLRDRLFEAEARDEV
jgi:RNA polymerase sigma-70 factor (ECF subfamily)